MVHYLTVVVTTGFEGPRSLLESDKSYRPSQRKCTHAHTHNLSYTFVGFVDLCESHPTVCSWFLG